MQQYPEKIDFHRYGVYIAAALILFFYLVTVLLQCNGYESIIIENGETSFTAEFETVQFVAAANMNPDDAEKLDDYAIALTIEIQDENGDIVAYLEIDDVSIYSDGFASIESFQMEGCPFELEPGKTYTVQYWAYSTYTLFEDLAIILYGGENGMVEEAIVLGLMAVILMAGLWLVEEKDHPVGYVVIYLAVAGMLMLSMPSFNADEEERTAFANAYAASSSMLGRETADEEGYIYIEESGIRLMGNTTDTQTLHRFWTDWSDGNAREEGVIGTSYQKSEGILAPFLLLDAMAIALMRWLNAPYQFVYLSGILVNFAFGFAVFLVVLRILRRKRNRLNRDPFSLLIIFMFLMPSMQQEIMSYHGIGIYLAVIVALMLVLWEKIPEERICTGILGGCIVLCFIGITRVILTGGNPLLVLPRSISYYGNDWLVEMIVVEAGDSGGLDCAALCMILSLSAMVIRIFHSGKDTVLEREAGEMAHHQSVRGDASGGKTREIPDRVWKWMEIGTVAASLFTFMLCGPIDISEGGEILLSGLSSSVLLVVLLLVILMFGRPSAVRNAAMDNLPSEEREELLTQEGWRYLLEGMIMLIAFIAFRCVGGLPV